MWEDGKAAAPEQAAFVHVVRTGAECDDHFWNLECQLRAGLAETGAGELGGVEEGDDEWIAFAYGRSADSLVRALDGVLRCWDVPAGSYLAWRRGGLEAPEERRALRTERVVAATRVRVLTPADLLAAFAIRVPTRIRAGPPSTR
jgi:hypothetical protein